MLCRFATLCSTASPRPVKSHCWNLVRNLRSTERPSDIHDCQVIPPSTKRDCIAHHRLLYQRYPSWICFEEFTAKWNCFVGSSACLLHSLPLACATPPSFRRQSLRVAGQQAFVSVQASFRWALGPGRTWVTITRRSSCQGKSPCSVFRNASEDSSQSAETYVWSWNWTSRLWCLDKSPSATLSLSCAKPRGKISSFGIERVDPFELQYAFQYSQWTRFADRTILQLVTQRYTLQAKKEACT